MKPNKFYCVDRLLTSLLEAICLLTLYAGLFALVLGFFGTAQAEVRQTSAGILKADQGVYDDCVALSKLQEAPYVGEGYFCWGMLIGAVTAPIYCYPQDEWRGLASPVIIVAQRVLKHWERPSLANPARWHASVHEALEREFSCHLGARQ